MRHAASDIDLQDAGRPRQDIPARTVPLLYYTVCRGGDILETRKKKRLLNILMFVLIAVIAFCAVMAVSAVKGNMAGNEPSSLVKSQDIKGAVFIERKEVSYSLESGIGLMPGDKVSVESRSGADFSLYDSGLLYLSENTELTLDQMGKDQLQAGLASGQIYTETEGGPVTFTAADGVSVQAEDAVFSLSAYKGSTQLMVFAGSADISTGSEKQTVQAGSSALVTDEDALETEGIGLSSGSGAVLEKLAGASRKGLCFSKSDLKNEIRERADQAQESAENELETSDAESSEVQDPPQTETGSEPEIKSARKQTSEKKTETASKKKKTSEKSSQASSSASQSEGRTGKASAKNTKKKSTASSAEKKKSSAGSCTIKIECSSILKHMDQLAKGKDRYVPEDGVILAKTKVALKKGESAYDVTKRVCKAQGIQMEAAYTPGYGSYYIEGINNLYEFDCGETSGWLYQVNGWEPNYGSSEYEIKDGDAIVWTYTCSVK